MPKLNPKEEKFCIAYASNANAKQSVIDAGYSMKGNAAGSYGYKLLQKKHIKQRIKKLADEANSKLIADKNEIQKILTSIARGEAKEEQLMVVSNKGMGDVVHDFKLPSNFDRIKAADLLAKMQGAYDTSTNVNVSPVIIVGEMPDDY